MVGHRALLFLTAVQCCAAQTCDINTNDQYDRYKRSFLVDRYKPNEDFPSDGGVSWEDYIIASVAFGVILIALGVLAFLCCHLRNCCTCKRLDRKGCCVPSAAYGDPDRPCRKFAWILLLFLLVTSIVFFIIALVQVPKQSEGIRNSVDSLEVLADYLSPTLSNYVSCIENDINHIVNNATALLTTGTAADDTKLNSIISDTDSISDLVSDLSKTITDASNDIRDLQKDAEDYTDSAGDTNQYFVTIIFICVFACTALGALLAAAHGYSDSVKGNYKRTCCFSHCFIWIMFIVFLIAGIYAVVVVVTAGYCYDPLENIAVQLGNSEDEARFKYYLRCDKYSDAQKASDWPWKSDQDSMQSNVADLNSTMNSLESTTSLDVSALRTSVDNALETLAGDAGIFGIQGVLQCAFFNAFLQALSIDFCTDLYDPTAYIMEFCICIAFAMCFMELVQKCLRREPGDNKIAPATPDDGMVMNDTAPPAYPMKSMA